MEQRTHPTDTCKSYIAPQQKFIPMTCPWGCGESVYRVELEDHAIKAHGQKPNPPKPRHDGGWLAGAPQTSTQRRDAKA